MTSNGKSSTLFVQVVLFVLALVLLLATCMADSDFHGRNRNTAGLRDMKVPKQSPVKCNSVHAVQDGETCIAIAQQFKLALEDLSAINPNLVCDKLFVGQWLCIDGGSAK